MELRQYIPVLMMIALAVICVVGMLVGSIIVGKVGIAEQSQRYPFMNAEFEPNQPSQAATI
jgi:NADH:ubiquinone oxidoreductase subunit 3 (subunit A)